MSELSLQDRLSRFAHQSVETACGCVQFRQAGDPNASRTLILLHGIGSGAASWLPQLEAAASMPQHTHLLAWEAPGYGGSQAVTPLQPTALAYANHLWAWLDALKITQPITLVGHSLGALIAGCAAIEHPTRVQKLVLLSPAQGYGSASETVRNQKRNDRLHNLNTLGPEGMAAKRGSAMLSKHASAAQIQFIQQVMAQVHVAGYTQATHLLAQGDLVADLGKWTGPLVIASGRADTITPIEGCQALAANCHVPWHDLGDVGHACALEGAQAVNALLELPSITKAKS